MKVDNSVFPTAEQISATFSAPEDGAFVMVNLLKFKVRASYENGEDVSGRTAYTRYALQMRAMVEAAGGRLLYSGKVSGLMVGEVEELWDTVGLMEYPSRAVFRQITRSPEYREIEKHRIAGLAGQLNIETKSDLPGR